MCLSLSLGQLLTRLAEKGISFQITSNPVERSIVWTMSVPENIAQVETFFKFPNYFVE